MILVHEDGEKSICAKLRASKIIPFSSVNMELVEEAKMLFIEGYWLDNNLLTVKRLLMQCARVFSRVALTLSDPQIVSENADFFAKYMGKIDIILGNENEFEALGDSILPPLAVKTLGLAALMYINTENGSIFKLCRFLIWLIQPGQEMPLPAAFLFGGIKSYVY